MAETLRISIEYTDGQIIYENTYDVLPSDLKGKFPVVIQGQLDILNKKDAINQKDLDALMDTEVKDTSLGIL